MDDFSDIENLRLEPTVRPGKAATGAGVATHKGATARARRRKTGFVMLPLAWKDRLSTARNICTFKVALELQFRHWKSRGKPISLANAAMAQIGVSAQSKWRALRELEALGLVAVERRPRRSPIITVLQLPEGDAP